MLAAIIILILIFVIFGIGGAFLHLLWILLIIGLIIWVLGFFIRMAEGGGRWYRW